MVKFGEVLKERNFFLLWLGQIISQFGDRLNQMVLIAIVYYEKPNSPFELAKFFSFTVIPSFIISPIAGAFIDRWDKKRTMITCDLLRGLFVLVIPLAFLALTQELTPRPLIYSVIFLIFTVSCFFLPARLAMIPDLVSKDKLLVANSLFTVTGMIGAIFWFVVGGILVEVLKVRGGLYLNAFVYLLSALAIVFIARKKFYSKPPQAVVNIEQIIRTSLFREIKDGFSYLISHREAKFALNVLFILMAGVGASYAVVIVFIQEAMGSMTSDLGLLGLFLGSGFFAGSLLYGKFGQRFSKARTIFGCLALAGIAMFFFTALLKWTHSFLYASCAAVFLGTAIAPISISTNTLIHEATFENMRGRVFASLGVAMNFAFLVFMFAASKLAETLDKSWILYSVSVFYVVCGITGFVIKRKG